MNNSSARNNILSKIAQALIVPSESQEPEPEIVDPGFFISNTSDLVDKFSTEFAAIDGMLVCCHDKHSIPRKIGELIDRNGWENIYFSKASLSIDLGLEGLPFVTNTSPDTATAVITGCEYLIARTGTIVLSAAQEYGRALTVFTPVHIVVASVDQLVDDLGDGILRLLDKYRENLPSALFFATGPSRTGDIEKTLVKGVHGPTQVYLFLLDSAGALRD
jgi:L-lactate dehydrogenase complex protein LldG